MVAITGSRENNDTQEKIIEILQTAIEDRIANGEGVNEAMMKEATHTMMTVIAMFGSVTGKQVKTTVANTPSLIRLVFEQVESWDE